MSRTTARIATVTLLLAGMAAPALASTQTAPAPAQAGPAVRQPAAAEVRAAYDRADALSRQIFWTDQAEIDPMDPVAGVKAAQALRELGRFDQAAEMAGKVLMVQPDNVEAMLESGRAHIARGQAFYGIAALEGARNARPGDWRAWSLLGTAYEQVRRPDDARAMKLYRLCAARKLPALWHCGPVEIEPALLRYMSQLRHYERAIAENPATTFALGHSGALQMDQAVEYARRYDNVWLEVSSQSVGNMGRLLDTLGDERVMYGTDWAFYHQAIALAKVLMATEGLAQTRARVLRGNAARLLGLSL